MRHIASLWEATSVYSGSNFSKVVYRSRGGRRRTTVFNAESAFETDGRDLILRDKMTMTLDDLFLGFRVHLVSRDHDVLLYCGVQKVMLN